MADSDICPALFAKDASVMRKDVLRGVGVRMREQRETLGYTLEDVATGTSTATGILYLMERGEKRPSANLLYWLARAGADITFVLTGQSNPVPHRNRQPEALRASAG